MKKNKKYACFLISNKPHLYSEVIKGLETETINFYDGSNVKSFAELVNKCVASCKTEIVILMSDKMRPTDNNIQQTLTLINQGYAFVGLYRFGFFGFKKELFRKIGPLDERFVGGCYEDDDFYIRMCEANLAIYLSHDVEYVGSNSSWNPIKSREHFYKKWNHSDKTYRKLKEASHNYNFGPSVPADFLSWSHTKLLAKKIKKYEDLEIGYE
jgi:GT2 family glycosyltransferase